MPPSQPLLSEQAGFAKHLFLHGYPLWNPDPDLLPRARQSVGLKIGDVGTVDERGRFDFFFNILESLPGSAGSTPNFPPIEDDDVRCFGEDLLPRVVVSSPETPWDVDQLEVLDVAGVTRRTTQYGATLSDDGAHVILPQGAQSFELGLHHRRLFENHAREHGADWLERFRDRLGWPRSNSLYLLTGFYKTCSWSIASFSMQTAANTDPVRVHCALVEVDERTIREASVWSPSGRFKQKIGPPPDRQGQNNQTIFIRGITVTPNLSEQGPSERRKAGFLGRLFSATRFLNSLAGDSTKASATETSKSSIIIQHVPQISQASHPSEIINQYLLTKEPSAKIAVTHDGQWIAMLKLLEEGQSWTTEALENHLEALVPVHYSIGTHKDTVYLRDKEDGSLTHFGVDQSHLPGDLASDITSDKKPYARGSFEDVQSIADSRVLSDVLGVTDGPPSHTTDSSPDRIPRPSVSSRSASPPPQSVRSHPSQGAGSPTSSHYTSSSHSSRPSSVKDSSTIIATSSDPLSNLGNSFPTRFQRFGKPSDLEQDSASRLPDEDPLTEISLLESSLSSPPKEAIVRYSTGLSLNPLNPAGLIVKQSKARAGLALWEDSLKDADEAIKADPLSPWGYERRHAALHALQRYDEAIDTFSHMLSLIQESHDQEIRQLGKKYVPPSRSEAIIDKVVHGVFRICPLVLIDVKSGRLCDGTERMHIFKSEPQFKELVSSMTEKLDDIRILRVVEKYFEYVTLSHEWEGQQSLFQDIKLVNSVWDLDSLPLNENLRKFCEVVRSDGYRWAWSDTCCIDVADIAVLNQSLAMTYEWYEASAATLVLLASVESPSAIGDLTDSIWMTRAWTVQQLLAPKVIRFYDRNWKPYLGDTRANHKESPEIMQELADAIGVARKTITAFNSDDLSAREKLRLASTRNATRKEDAAYSLMGMFKSYIVPRYGEGDAALGRLLEKIVARSGDVTVLDWIGESSPYNSCLPATLAVYSQTPCASPVIEDAEVETRVAALRDSLSQTDAILIHDQVTRLPPARFANRRLHLPCILFAVIRLGVEHFGSGGEIHYRARVLGIGNVEFKTSDRLSSTEPRKLVFVHPWIRDLRNPLDGFTWEGASDSDEYKYDPEAEGGSAPASPSHALPTARKDKYTRALHLVVRLQQPFHALLLQQQSDGVFKRVAAEHEIILPRLEPRVRDIRTEVVEIL